MPHILVIMQLGRAIDSEDFATIQQMMRLINK